MSIALDLIIVIICASTIFLTYKKGFVKSILQFAASILSIILSHLLSPILAESYLSRMTDSMQDKHIPESALSLFSYVLAFLTLLIVLNLVLRVAAVLLSTVFKLPVLKKMNKTLGIVLGCVEALISVFLLVALLQIAAPFFNNAGSSFLSYDMIQKTIIFKYIYKIDWINFLVN